MEREAERGGVKVFRKREMHKGERGARGVALETCDELSFQYAFVCDFTFTIRGLL